ncbi:MAG: hypothetical protein QM572_19495 [Nocardioides sp.]|uniref:hypothetical protein n=1 Tax=Nocardioides sp. TaxID=35761 RepID=UPI0039E426C6
MKDERASYETTARQVAEHIIGTEAVPFAPQRMSKYAHWFTDTKDSALVAIVTPGEKVTAGDEVLAYGLAWQQNRDLFLVLPQDMVGDAQTRIGWIDTEVRIWEHGEAGPRPVPKKSRAQLLAQLRDLPERRSKAVELKAGHTNWIDGIDTTDLSAHERSYLSWHHEGLQVLKVAETRAGLRIQAGVQYGTPPPGREPFDKVFAVAPTPGEVAVINAKIRLAVEDGGSQTSQMREHKMQATLVGKPETLGLTDLWREFPAWRGPNGRPGYIDFLGVDAEGRLHVIETKIGHDPKVVLQALDYAVWVKANDAAIRERLHAAGHALPTPEDVESHSVAPIHLVLGSSEKEKAFNGYLVGQIEALAGDVRVKVHVTADPTAQPLSLTEVPKRKLRTSTDLIAEPVAGPRWAESITDGLLRSNP